KVDAPIWFYKNFAALSQSARNIHTIYVGFLVYCALTIRSTTDRQIVLNEGARLPLINVDVPFSLFLVAAPLAAVFIYLYFQLHIQVMKRQLREYHVPIRDRIYPWMLNLAENSEKGALGLVQRLIVSISLWWLMPTVLLLFAALAIRTRNAIISCFELVIYGLGVLVVFWLYSRYHNVPSE